MANSKQTKRALLTGTLAIVVCVAMLIGSTFAWFTDTASTAVNKIQAGTLDIRLLAEDSKTSLEGKTIDFIKADTASADEEILWEPGCTYKLQPIVIKNAGTLALKYKIVISGIKGDAKLNEAIEWTIDGLPADGEQPLLAGESTTLNIQGHMRTDAGNDYQGLSIDGVGITVYATQYTHENDSFDNTYDKDAKYTLTVDSVDALKIAAQNAKAGDEIVLAKDITLSETVRFAASGITFNGNGHTITADMTDAQVENLATLLSFGYGTTYCTGVTVKDLTFTGKGGRAMHFHGGKSSLLQNVKISGEWSLAINFYGTHGAVMENCDISSTYANKYAKGSIFANEQSANQIILNNTKIDSLFVNATEAGATYANGGIKLVVGAGSVINELHTNKGITRTFHKVNGGTVGAVLADVD